VADIDTMWMLANVAETDSPAFRIGQQVQVRLAAFSGSKNSQYGSSDIPPVRSKATHENQHEEDDQNDPDDTDPAVTVAVAVPAEAAAEAAQQEDDEDDDEYESDRHDLSPVAAPNRHR
jgi:hypothetical protein